MDKVLLLCISANEHSGRQFLLAKDDNDIVGWPRNRISGGHIRDMEELERIAGNRYLKMTIDSRDGTDLAFRHTYLHIFDGISLLIDNPPFDGDAILCRKQGREEEQKCRY